MPDSKASTASTTPTTLGLEPSFGFGDRLGLAAPGHLAALQQAGGPIRGIFAQQSIREMTRTKRTAEQVMTAATRTLTDAGFDEPWGADADHLKTPEDVDVTAAAGFTFFTIDPSDHVDQQADNYDERTLQEKYDSVAGQIDWIDQYQGQTIAIEGGPTIVFDNHVVQRAAVKYGHAINEARKLGEYIRHVTTQKGQPYEIELSVDETDQPTTPAEHYIIAEQCLKAGMKLVSLAPRFIGELEKGVDYIGDLDALEKSMNEHAAIARQLGPYKLSLHSGSDKCSMYPILARTTQGLFHVKTAGTSYLEALRVVLRHDEPLFRKIVEFSRGRYETDRATYHVHAEVDKVPAPADLNDPVALEKTYLERWQDVPEGKAFTESGRQILHCTFGSVLTDPTLGPAVMQCLADHPDTHRDILCDHFARHLKALRAGM